MYFKSTICIILLIQFINSGLIDSSVIQSKSKIIELGIEQSEIYKVNRGEDLVIAKYSSYDGDIYELSLKPLKGKVNDLNNELCQAYQPKINFYKNSKSLTPAFPEYFKENGFLANVQEQVPVLLDFVRTKDGILAIDTRHNLLTFTLQEGITGLYLEKTSVHSISELGSDMPTEDFPVLAYTYMHTENQEKEYIYLLYKESAYFYDASSETKFTKMDNWLPIAEIKKVKIQYGYNKKQSDAFSNFVQNAQLFVAAGTDGFHIYNINYGDIQLQPPKKFTELQSGKQINIVDFSHINFEPEVFILDKHEGVRKIKLNLAHYGTENNKKFQINGTLQPRETFNLALQQGQFLVHFSRYSVEEPEKIVNQSFITVSSIQRNQYITEFDYDPVVGNWWQAERIKYNWHFEIKSMIIEKNYVIFMGSHFSKVMRHSIYHLFTKYKHHKMSKQEQLNETVDDTLVVPGLIRAEFLSNNYDNIEEFKLLQYKYMIGITAHNAILYSVQETPAYIRCNMMAYGYLESGTYKYEVELFQTSCKDTTTNETYADYIACRHTKVIGIEVDDLVEKKMPWWGVLLIVLGVLLVVAGCVFGGIKIYKARKNEQKTIQQVDQKEEVIEQKEQDVKKAKYEIMDDDEEEI